jgi:hypothetical protein
MASHWSSIDPIDESSVGANSTRRPMLSRADFLLAGWSPDNA